jgi:hypothetical protein
MPFDSAVLSFPLLILVKVELGIEPFYVLAECHLAVVAVICNPFADAHLLPIMQ